MSTKEIADYYKATKHRDIREELAFAITNDSDRKIAIDCGFGAGVIISYRYAHGFKIHDIEKEAISICTVLINSIAGIGIL